MHQFNTSNFISEYITKRSRSLFQDDWDKNETKLLELARDRSILVIGGAGSIGSQFIKSILTLRPDQLIVVDHNENGLTELTRDLRSDSEIVMPASYRTYPINFGSKIFQRILAEYQFDIVANFAAHKHVRSEKDHIAIEAMIHNNIFYVDDLLANLKKHEIKHTFCVSTDKAANPANVMGATKQIMEHIIRSHTSDLKITTARFANVAFSNGSLLDGFLYRMKKGQPLSAPSDVTRYFVSPQESGQLCVLTCLLGMSGDIYFPKLKESQMMSFSDIASLFLEKMGLQPLLCQSEEEAKLIAQRRLSTEKTYPVFYFKSNTSGEKPFEEFYTTTDEIDLKRHTALGVVKSRSVDRTEINHYLQKLKSVLDSSEINKSLLVDTLKQRLPEFNHIETGLSLDDKM